MSTSDRPEQIRIRRKSRVLQLDYAGGTRWQLPFELLRVCSPSAEVRGHGQGPGTLQTGKKDVMLTDVAMVGNYALKLTFDDGHDSGLYTWDYLWQLGEHQERFWQDYLNRLKKEGGRREAAVFYRASN